MKKYEGNIGKISTVGGFIGLVLLVPFIIKAIDWRTSYLIQVYSILPIWIIAGLSLTIITGYVGEISIAQAALMGMAAYVSAILSTQGLSVAVSVIAGLIASVLASLVLGVPTLRLRGPYFVVASMAFNGIFHVIVNNWINVTRGPNGISNIPTYSRVVFWGKYIPWVIAFLCLGFVWYLSQTRLGKSMMAIRDDELAARAIGIRVPYFKVVAFVISGLLAGIAGVLLGHLIGFISPAFYTIDQSLFVLTIALLGGVRSVEGAALGAILMIIVTEALREVASIQLLLYGLIMLIVILFVPNGLVSIMRRNRD